MGYSMKSYSLPGTMHGSVERAIHTFNSVRSIHASLFSVQLGLILQTHTAIIVSAIAAVAIAGIILAAFLGRKAGRRSLEERLSALAVRLGVDLTGEPGESGIEPVLHHLEQVTGQAAEVVSESSEESIRFRKVLDSLDQGVLICDVNGQVVFRNNLAMSLMGGRHGDAIIAQGVVDLLQAAWGKGSEERTIDLYGPPKRSLVLRAQVIDDGRKSLGVIAIIEDVTERHRIDEIRRDFVTNVSHELKTPISALGLLAETLVDEEDTTVAKRLASRIQKEAFRVSRIIDDLLDLSRIEAEESPQREPVEINFVVADAVERLRSTAEQKGITIDQVEEEEVAVLGDRRQLASAVYNLVENAIKFSDAGSHVAVAVRISPDTSSEVEIHVTDHGIGIPAKDLERIFERFYRVDISRSHKAGGTGLGLSIVRHAISNHGGRIEVDSREGQGSTFKITLPILYGNKAIDATVGNTPTGTTPADHPITDATPTGTTPADHPITDATPTGTTPADTISIPSVTIDTPASYAGYPRPTPQPEYPTPTNDTTNSNASQAIPYPTVNPLLRPEQLDPQQSPQELQDIQQSRNQYSQEPWEPHEQRSQDPQQDSYNLQRSQDIQHKPLHTHHEPAQYGQDTETKDV